MILVKLSRYCLKAVELIIRSTNSSWFTHLHCRQVMVVIIVIYKRSCKIWNLSLELFSMTNDPCLKRNQDASYDSV